MTRRESKRFHDLDILLRKKIYFFFLKFNNEK